ncbi:hypothetical protein HDV00_004167 [Rhizophlyctis rosea]|nr:hypothetical protein HDV00_004167 [Rhizophlyctis rosea]
MANDPGQGRRNEDEETVVVEVYRTPMDFTTLPYQPGEQKKTKRFVHLSSERAFRRDEEYHANVGQHCGIDVAREGGSGKVTMDPKPRGHSQRNFRNVPIWVNERSVEVRSRAHSADDVRAMKRRRWWGE